MFEIFHGIFFPCVSVLPVVCIYTTCVSGAHKRAESPEQELKIVGSHHVVLGTKARFSKATSAFYS